MPQPPGIFIDWQREKGLSGKTAYVAESWSLVASCKPACLVVFYYFFIFNEPYRLHSPKIKWSLSWMNIYLYKVKSSVDLPTLHHRAQIMITVYLPPFWSYLLKGHRVTFYPKISLIWVINYDFWGQYLMFDVCLETGQMSHSDQFSTAKHNFNFEEIFVIFHPKWLKTKLYFGKELFTSNTLFFIQDR